ncbi:MAG: succinate dehydrogenase assembly factor 2 [Burkholderiales bacterium]
MLAAKQQERLRWRCRRGMLELDLLLARFLTEKIDTLDESQGQLLDRFLTYPDQDLFDWLMARKKCEDPSILPVLELILTAK